MYWAWSETAAQEKERLKKKLPVPPPPTTKRLDYVTIDKGAATEHKLCIGVWDDEKYTPLHRNELEFHIKQY